ncbi:diguanylate cyclase, partial [Acinetobacter variabilis]
IYIAGKFILRPGESAKSAEEQRNERAPRIGYFGPESEYFTMSIQASNYTHLHGGIEQTIRIGTAGTINRQYQQLMMSISMVCGLVLG